MLTGVLNWIPSKASLLDLPYSVVRLATSKRVEQRVNQVALWALQAFTASCCPALWATSFAVGFVFHDSVDEKITKPLGEIAVAKNWTWVVPTVTLLYWLYLPYVLITQSCLFGLQAGSYWTLKALRKQPSYPCG